MFLSHEIGFFRPIHPLTMREEIRCYTARMWENADQDNSEYGHFLPSVNFAESNFIKLEIHVKQYDWCDGIATARFKRVL